MGAKPPKWWNLNMTGWTRKLEGATQAMNLKIMPGMVDKGMDILTEEVSKNLQGVMHAAGTPSPTPGQLPVSKITSHLAEAVHSERLKPTLGIVFIDKGTAPYALPVHRGVKRDGGGWQMRPRKFFSEAVRVMKAKLYPVWKAQMSAGLKGVK